MTDPIQIWVSHMGNHTSTKAESLQAKRDILVPQGLLLGCPVAAAQICTASLSLSEEKELTGSYLTQLSV